MKPRWFLAPAAGPSRSGREWGAASRMWALFPCLFMGGGGQPYPLGKSQAGAWRPRAGRNLLQHPRSGTTLRGQGSQRISNLGLTLVISGWSKFLPSPTAFWGPHLCGRRLGSQMPSAAAPGGLALRPAQPSTCARSGRCAGSGRRA